jgi:hypothetical protein
LTKKLEFDSKNDDYLKEALEALVGCKVKWNVLDKDNKWEWGVTTLLAHATIKDGLCTYSYSPPLRERLHNPNIYARISLSMQNKFDSKHALALWELCLDSLDRPKQYGETPWIPLETFRELMGIAEEMYPEFKKLNKGLKNNEGSQRGSGAGTMSTNHFPKGGHRSILASPASMASWVQGMPV